MSAVLEAAPLPLPLPPVSAARVRPRLQPRRPPRGRVRGAAGGQAAAPGCRGRQGVPGLGGARGRALNEGFTIMKRPLLLLGPSLGSKCLLALLHLRH